MKNKITLLLIAICLATSAPLQAQRPASNRTSFLDKFKWKTKKQRQMAKLLKPLPSYVDGTITNEDTQEKLAEAYILFPSPWAVARSNTDGYFTLKARADDAQIKIIHPDVFDTFYAVMIHKELYTPVGAIRLKPIMIGEKMQAQISCREPFDANQLRTTKCSTIDILKQGGTPDFNLLLQKHAAIENIDRGGAWGEAELKVRGLPNHLLQVQFNGININNPETEKATSNLYAGIGNWARKTQITRGAANSHQSAQLSGGLLHIDGFMPRQKKGTHAQFTYGSGSYLQGAAAVHSGVRLNNQFAASLQLDGSASQGINQHTAHQSLGAYLTLYGKTYVDHQFSANIASRYWNKNLNQSPLYLAQAEQFGTALNNSWSKTQNNGYQSWNTSAGISNLASFHHQWQINRNQQLVSTIYAQLEQSKFGDTIIQSQINEQNRSHRLGAQTRFIHQKKKNTQWWIAADFDYYQNNKKGETNHLLAYIPFYIPADTTAFEQRNRIVKYGATAHFQTQTKRWTWLGEFALYRQAMQQNSWNQALSAENTETLHQWGYRVLQNIGYQLSKQQKIQLKLAASAAPQRFSTVFPSYSNWKNNQWKSRLSQGVEIAYIFQRKALNIELRAFSYLYQNLGYWQNNQLDMPQKLLFVSQAKQRHQGAEITAEVVYLRKHQLHLSGSINRFIYAADAQAETYFGIKQEIGESKKLNTKGHAVENTTPYRIYAENTFSITKALSLSANYQHNFGTYAATKGSQQVPQLLEGYGLLGAEISYYKDFKRPGSRLQIYAQCHNLLNTTYINQIWQANNHPTPNDASYPAYENIYNKKTDSTLAQFGLPRNWCAGFRYVF